MSLRCVLLIPLALATAAPCAAQTFSDETDRLRPNGPPDRPLGASAVDVNADGWVDLYQHGLLYINSGGVTYDDIMPQSGLDEGDFPFGAIFGDYTNDGLPDVFFEDITSPSNVFRSAAPGVFVSAMVSSGINTDGLPVQGSAWLDYDNDGKLDLFIGGDGDQDKLYRNIDYATFADESDLVDLQTPRQNYGLATGDVDRDGTVDIYIAACSSVIERSRNVLWLNGAETGYRVITAGVEDTSDSWGALFFDYNNDGWLDLYVLNSPHSAERTGKNRLYRFDRLLTFVDEAETAGVAGGEQERGYTGAAADFDNDGWTDLIVINSQDFPDHYYRNNGGHSFTELNDTGLDLSEAGAVAVADFDNDGWVDVFAASDTGGALFINDGGSNNWLKVGLRGATANYYGVGARVEVKAGALSMVREISAGDGMTSQNHAFIAHFGLGTEETVDSLIVRWPGGTVDRFGGIDPNRHLIVFEGENYSPVGTEGQAVDRPVDMDAYPNPFSEEIRITIPGSLVADPIEVFDMLGRKFGEIPSGREADVVWDGRDLSGAVVPPGVYLIRARVEDGFVVKPVVKGGR